MATEVPVSDVLCEAMEYLCKLGSNLRNRSESLKEKKIRKDKLKNTHAVQKAASKVLLICELSKKSIENVETGIRKVLSLVDISQAPTTSNGGKTKSTKDHNRDKNKSDYYCFEYKSRTLRIAKKVSLKHYRSVKVMAKNMSPSMLEKYPVYYNCKLFRLRKRSSDHIERIRKNSSNSNSNRNKDNQSLNQHHLDTSDVGKSDDDQNTESCIDENDPGCTDETHNVTRPISDKIKPTDIELPEKNSSTKTDDEQISQKDKKPSECVEISDDDSLPTKTSNSDSQDLEEKDYKHNKRKKSKKLRFTDDSSENEIQIPNPIDDKAKSSSPELMETDNNAVKESESKKSDSGNNSESKKTDNEQMDENSKPLIRCVNISRLLKPEVLPIVKDKTPSISKSNKFSYKEKCSNNVQMENVRKRQDSSSDEEFWIQKRKEVKQFKSKIFCINVKRLPELSINFLVAHNLKRITRKGKIVCEVSCENESTENNNRSKTGMADTESSIENKTTKESLLKESDSEEEQKRTKTIKDKLLNNSDSDSSRKLKKSRKKIKTMVLDDTDSDSETNKPDKDKNATQEVIKKSLLNDSDSDSNKISDSDSKIPKEKENIQKESIKKSLLEESDSDSNKSCKDDPKKVDEIKNNNKNYDTKEDSDSNKKSDSENKKSNEKSQKDTLKESLLHESDSDSNKSVKDVSKETDEIKKGNKKSYETDETLKDDSNKKSDSKKNSNKKDVTHKEAIKESLLHESDSDSNKGVKDVPKKPDEIKKALLNNDDVSEENATSSDGKQADEKIKNALLNDSDDNKSVDKPQSPLNTEKENEFECNDDLNLGSVVDNIIKESFLKDSTLPNSENKVEPNNSNKDETAPEEKVESQNDKTNNDLSEKLNDDEAKQDESSTKEEPSKEDLSPTKIKKSLLNDSSSSLSDEDTPRKQKVKLSKSKRDSAKKSIKYSSSSDEESKQSGHSSDERKNRSKRSRRKSSSSSDYSKKKSKRKRLAMSSDDEDSDSKKNSRVKKMVRSKNKPSGSSGQSSDNQDASDKDIDGLTNLNTLNKKHRSRDSSSNNTSSRKKEIFKPTPTIGEDLLQAQSSSEESDHDNDLEEDLPPITMSGHTSGPNGDTIDHLAKDDLLVESDSSHSHKDTDETPTANDSEEENVKSKRRKANAISSDSDGGTSRRKQEVKVSDFDDSEDESSDAVKRSKRKKEVDSDASVGSSEGKKKRRRIKQIASDESGSGSDTENEGRNKHGRKNIRKVMGKNQLEEATKKAAREEKERVARIAERQKMYNNLEFDESGKPDEVILDKVVLDFDPETKEPLIQVDRGLVKKLKPHQANGIKFMWNACFESVKRIKKDRGSGCILAHCMGLGKTLQVISLTHTLLIHEALTNVNRVLVVCPLSTVLNWVNEFKMWLKHADSEFEVDVYELSRYKQNSERAFQLQQWLDGGGVCVLGYEMFRNLSADNNKKFKKKMLKSFQESLVDPGPDMVVCDEGHLLKNEKTSLSQSMNRVKTRRRIVLTGTPLQNNLKEYYCMVQFVKPNLLGKYNEYLNRFVNPITNGQYTDSTEHDIRVMKRRSHVLHKMLDGAVQRRDYGVLAPFLPPKHEYVLFITLSEVQIKLYQYYLDNYSRRPLAGKSSGFLFPDFQSLQRIWTHPLVLKYNSERYEIMQQKKREREEEDSEGSLVDFIDDDSTPDESSTEESTDDSSDLSDDSRKKSKKKKSGKKAKNKDSKLSTRRGTRANPAEIEEDVPEVSEVVEIKNENPTEWWIKLVEEEELEDMRNSHKLVLLFDILRQCEAIGDKLLVFSQSLYSLDLIEHFLGKVDEATQEGRIDEKLGGHVGSWSPGVDYFRLDGSTSCENRSIWCKNFNREDNPRARLFLISTRAGGLGINLVAANRVVIFDVSWNPSHDVQSIFRVYRFGQKKPCYVYRFLAMGTMEEKIYERQVTKQAISKRVIDEQQIDRHYAENDLAELYKFEARPEAPREIPALPKDRLFAEMLKDHEQQIYKYHEHDSLLENKEEETLSEEERKAAWDDFENEKTRPPPAPFPSTWPMHNGMVPGMLAQQQQQLAYAALAAMLRKDMPNISDNQIRDMLPLIYSSNPGMFGGYDYGLMQKMSEIYKYAQPGMMNPSMINPMMNSDYDVGGASGGMSGTSGLQYEPPWQRQHQQQQQMRLQQLLQQQQNMGAKFYAGGLGSRDPVAMALQQQRAREIMLGAAGRPRGRPPLAPRAPTTHADVVNLDSD